MAITIDEMLDLLSFASAELVNGNANHGPMAAEPLFTLGRDDAVLPWVDEYRKRLIYRPSPALPIPPEEWREYLGARERLGDWIELFENELSEAPWQEVVRQWVPRLAPAVMAAATHGFIRTSHAVRNLSAGETPQRKSELAQGLGIGPRGTTPCRENLSRPTQATVPRPPWPTWPGCTARTSTGQVQSRSRLRAWKTTRSLPR